MAKPATLQSTYKGGMKRDFAREALPQGACWNIVDFLPEVLGALCRNRGGWKYASQDLNTQHAGSARISCGIVAEFSAGQSLLVNDQGGQYYAITSPSVTEVIASPSVVSIDPVFYDDKAIFPDGAGASYPRYATRSGGTHLLASFISAPAGKYALVYKDVLWLAGSNAAPARIHFSVAGDPASWDTTTKWWDLSYPVTGLAALSNAALVFSLQRTARFRGSKPPPGTDFTVDDPLFEVGCTDCRSIVNYRDKVIFANAQGLYMTDGVALEDLTRVCGMKAWWRDIMKGQAGFSTGTPYALTWTIAGGIYDDFYFYSITNAAGAKVDAGMIDLTRYSWARISNLAASCLFQRLYPQELFWGARDAPRVNTISDLFNPTSANEVDGNGTAVLPVMETAFFGGEPGVKTLQTAFVTYEITGGTTPLLRVGYALTPEGASYTNLTPDLPAGTHTRRNLEINQPGLGISFRISQVGQSTDTRLHEIELAAGPRERSR